MPFSCIFVKIPVNKLHTLIMIWINFFIFYFELDFPPYLLPGKGEIAHICTNDGEKTIKFGIQHFYWGFEMLKVVNCDILNGTIDLSKQIVEKFEIK